MSSILIFLHGSLYAGLFCLVTTVLHSFLLVDIPILMDLPGCEPNAISHYTDRGRHYKMAVPMYCSALTLGVLGNAILERNKASIVVLLLAVGTAMNNGRNVVNPSKRLAKKNSTHLLKQMANGHVVDLVGFCLILICNLSL